MRTAFLSYRRRDSREATRALFAALVREFGSQHVFRDVDSIPAGVDFRAVIEDEIVRADVMLVVIGPQWLHLADAEGKRLVDQPGDFVRAEISRAFELQVPVVGVLVEDAPAPAVEQLPPALQPLAGCRFVKLSLADASGDRGLPQLFDFIRATPKSIRGPAIREQYAAIAAMAWRSALASTLLATLGGGLAVWLQWQGVPTVIGVMAALLAAALFAGTLAGWRAGSWLGAVIGAVLMPIATATAVILSLMCVVAPLLPLNYWLDSSTDAVMTFLSTIFPASVVGNVSGLYGMNRAAAARARRRKVSGTVLRIVGWWLLGVMLTHLALGGVVFVAQRLAGQSANPALNAMLGISACTCIATPLGALFGMAWQWASLRNGSLQRQARECGTNSPRSSGESGLCSSSPRPPAAGR